MSAEGRDLLGSGFEYPVERFRSRLLKKLNLPIPKNGATALELGCGDGLVSSWLAEQGWKVTSLDAEAHPNWKPLARRHKGRLNFQMGDAAKLGKLKGKYDLVFEKDMLHHVPDPVAVLRQMNAKGKKGGTLLVLEANRYNPVFYLHLTLMGDHQHFTPGQLMGHFKSAGIKAPELKRIEARSTLR